MTRGKIISLGVLILVVVVIGYYAVYSPDGGLRAGCTETFNRLASANGNTTIEPPEFMAYGQGVSKEEFSRADSDRNQVLSVAEFCSWESTQKG